MKRYTLKNYIIYTRIIPYYFRSFITHKSVSFLAKDRCVFDILDKEDSQVCEINNLEK